MRFLILICAVLSIVSCNKHSRQNTNTAKLIQTKFDSIEAEPNIQGSILIYDLKKDRYYSNDFNWAKIARLPASTFKIPHSLIALELGIVQDEKSIIKWNGEKRSYKIWQQDLTFKQAFAYSCVPCYQEIARKVGSKHMKEFIEKFNYGKMDIHVSNIDDFWLVGDSQINQFEQIDFLKRLYFSQLPISKRTEQIFKRLFIVKKTNDYTLRGKTGLSIHNVEYNGWYVGYLEKKDNIIFFATNISPQGTYKKSFNKLRKSITTSALKQLDYIN